MLSQLVFVREGHQAACAVTEGALEHIPILGMLRGHMPRQMILPLKRVIAFGAVKRSCILVDRLNVRVSLAWLSKQIPANVTLVLQRRRLKGILLLMTLMGCLGLH